MFHPVTNLKTNYNAAGFLTQWTRSRETSIEQFWQNTESTRVCP